ncbi:hypothetical protein PRUPE_2G210800 [Prunus persica]|uniref:Protein kinase domain-containing protein n=1 Tax=Prunus persica TaxID=3760 RepID=A0A251QJ25_PRUPE|nr:lysM domain receptor-like kinase 3 [Prunus persica]ONI23831.1 hypothetical protein PRUPE_2G210800 [Prunus persica]
MWTWGRKNKKGRLVIEPESPIEARSSSSVPTEDRPHSANSHTNFSSTSSTSSASASSFKSHIKSSLPENPLIYNKSDIHDALLSRRPGSSRRRLLFGKDVVIFQRESGLPLSYSDSDSELYHRLAQISKSHHTSLIKLLGASLSGPYVYLVYEYVQGANLADCLRNPNNPEFTVLSTWLSRMQVAADVADGLNYMHHSSGDNSVHNHIKSSNIIVSEQKNLQLRAKICHFATAALCCETQSLSATVEGTRVYMAPEAQLTHKCDVYAFGVVILELISGEEPLMEGNGGGGGGGCRRVSVIETARKAVSSCGGVRRWVDRRLKDSFPMEVAEQMVKVALQCVKEDPDSRPDMGRVAGWVANLFLESESWDTEMGRPIDMTISLAPR